MLCVTLTHGSHHKNIEEHQQLGKENIPLVEFRLDLFRREPDLRRLLTNRPTPVIITVRRDIDGGLWGSDEEKRLRLLRSAIIAGADYVDLEMDVAASIPKYGKTKRLISYHNLNETPVDLIDLHQEMLAMNPDVIKIATMPKNINDVFRMMAFLKEVNPPGVQVPTIGISMGEIGTVSRIIAAKFGSPITYCSFNKGRKAAPGMIDYQTMRDLYRYDTINRQTEIYGVVADPVEHSLSPLIHNASFAQCKLNKVYVPLLIHPEDLECFMTRAHEWGIKGLSVTIPHKVNVIKYLTHLEPAVEEINACNTVEFKDNHVLGDNTDYLAAVLAIEKTLKKYVDQPNPLSGKKVLVLGSGGAGKAIAFGLKNKGAVVTLTDGDNELAKSVATGLGCHQVLWADRNRADFQILCNCTPIGMYPKVNDIPIDPSSLHGNMLVFDAVYNPHTTYLLRQAKEKGCVPIFGIEMFVGQAALQFERFANCDADEPYMRGLVLKALEAVRGC